VSSSGPFVRTWGRSIKAVKVSKAVKGKRCQKGVQIYSNSAIERDKQTQKHVICGLAAQ
jgi:hypothetical protein